MRIDNKQIAQPANKAEQIIFYCINRFKEKGDSEALEKISFIDNQIKGGYEFIGLSNLGTYQYIKKYKEGHKRVYLVDVTEAEENKACIDHAVELDSKNAEFRHNRIKLQNENEEKIIRQISAQKYQNVINDTSSKIDAVIKKLDLE